MNNSSENAGNPAARPPAARRGRKPFSPSSELRKDVEQLCALGIRQSDIATLKDIAPQTLRKHFRAELAKGAIAANCQVLETLFKMAISGKNPGAAIFWAKTRCGFTQHGTVLPPEAAAQPAARSQRKSPAPEPPPPPPPGIQVYCNDGEPRFDL